MRLRALGRFNQRLAACLGLAGSIACLGATLRIAWADWVRRYNTEQSIRAAIAMAPTNWSYYLALAELNPQNAVTNLRLAVELNPRNVPLRIELGDYADQAGDLATAEQSLRSAVALGLTYAPRVELAGFYFRRRNREQFVKAARAALEIATGENTRLLFEDCWELLGSDGESISRDVIPDRVEVLRQYLAFVMETNRLEAARPVARRLMATGNGAAENGEALLRYCDDMLAAGDGAEASVAWTWLASRGLVRVPDLAAATGRGFDWRYVSGSGVYFEKAAGGLRVSFSGGQPENCDLVWRYVALEPGRNYRLSVKYRTPEPDAGLRWEVLAGGKDLLEGRGALHDGGAGQRAVDFEVPADSGLGRLVLRYERVRGTVRVEGDAEIGMVELKLR